MSDEFGHPQDQTRLCPTCRMPISILATRCRHCGETVARPRKAEEKFTVQDLGGEAKSEYTVSGDLMDAMESFRMELTSDEPAQSQPDRTSRWFARDSKSDGQRKSQYSDLELPTGSLEDLTNAEISYTTPPPRPATQVTRTAKQGGNKHYFVIGAVAFVIVAVVMFFIGGGGSMFSSPPEEESVYVNRALKMLEAGQPTIDVMEEARKALNHDMSDENKAIQAQVREEFIAEINAILSARKFEKEPLENALRLCTRAAELDPDASLQALLNQVDKDVNFHRFLLISIDRANNTATFDLNNPYVTERQQIVNEGDMLQGRFKVDRITSELVRLSDQEIDVPGGKRRLVARLLKGVVAG